MSVKYTTVSILPCGFAVLNSVVFLYCWYMIHPPCLACVILCQLVPNLGGHLARLISQIFVHQLERALTIDNRKKDKTLSYL